MKNNQVSIIVPTYNAANFISQTIESVLYQTYKEWELIIIDDASTDNTEEIVKKFVDIDNRIKYFKLAKNSGAAEARNYGIKLAKGEYIAFLDSDDLWDKQKLEKQIKFMKENNYNFTFTSYEKIDEKGEKLGFILKAIKKVNYNRILLDCPIGNSSVIYNSKNLGKFEIPNIRKRNDDALWLKILKKEKYAYGLDEVLMYYRIRRNSLSRNKIELIKYHWLLYRKIEKLSIPRSIFHILIWIFIKVFHIK